MRQTSQLPEPAIAVANFKARPIGLGGNRKTKAGHGK
jgi:hypothetical protein